MAYEAHAAAAKAAMDRDAAKTARMTKRGPDVSPAQYVAQMNLEDARKFQADLSAALKNRKVGFLPA